MNNKRKSAVSSTVRRLVGCSHPRADALALGVAFCRDCGRVLIQRNDGKVTTARAAGYTPNKSITGG